MTTAPAPSANSIAVAFESWSVMRLMKSAPITSTFVARPVSICAAPSATAERNDVHAAPMSIAPARRAPSACATSGAAFGVTSSCVIVATSTRSRSAPSIPARSSASRPAAAAKSDRRSSSRAMRRSRMPVRV